MLGRLRYTPPPVVLGVVVAMVFAMTAAVAASASSASEDDLRGLGDDVVIENMVFHNEEITYVLTTLVEMTSDLSIICDGSVSGHITQRLRGVTVMEAIELIVKTRGYDYRRRNGVIVVATPDRLESAFEDKETALIHLEHLSPASIIPLLTIVVPEESMRADPATSTLVVSGTKEEISLVRQLATHLDRPGRQVRIEARIEEIASNALSNLGLDWGGIDLTLRRNPLGQVIGAALDVEPLLGFLSDEGFSRTVASPQILVRSGDTGVILLGDRIPFLIGGGAEGGGAQRVEYVEAGVRLEVTPSVRNDGRVTLEVAPEISTVDTLTSQGLPWIKTREARTVVELHHGETAAIGGLLQTTELESLYKVPLLGDIPILGELFRRTDKDLRQTELIVFLTVHVVESGRQTETVPTGMVP